MKLQDIIEAIETRLASIDGTGSYNTKAGENIVRGKRTFDEPEMPACCLYLGPRSADITQGERQRVLSTVVIEAHSLVGTSNPGDIGIQLLSDIQRAVEDGDNMNLTKKLAGSLLWESDEISYPDDAGRFVAVQVVYNTPHVRRYGDPE